jgi:DNA polymerase III subunit beta
MKFVVSSTELLSHLTAISKVISNKSTLPILDNFLFTISDAGLTITASDSESTLITTLELDNVEGEGVVALPAKLLIDTLREFPEQPLSFQIDTSTFGIQIFSENGKFTIVGYDGADYPDIPTADEDSVISMVVSRKV